MTEAAIITIAIVAGIVGLFWVVIHYAYKLQAGKPEPIANTDIHVSYPAGMTPSDTADRMFDRQRYFGVN